MPPPPPKPGTLVHYKQIVRGRVGVAVCPPLQGVIENIYSTDGQIAINRQIDVRELGECP